MVEIKTMLDTAYTDIVFGLLNDGNSIDFNGERTVTSASEITALAFARAVAARDSSPPSPTARCSRRRWRCATSMSCRPRAIPSPSAQSWMDTCLGRAGTTCCWRLTQRGRPQSVLGHLRSRLDSRGAGEWRHPGRRQRQRGRVHQPVRLLDEIAAANQGSAGSVWRTDVAIKNSANALANVEFILHTDTAGNVTGTGAIDPMAQGIFET